MFARLLIALLTLACILGVATCAGAIPGWGRDSADPPAANDDADDGSTIAPGGDNADNGLESDDDGGTTPPTPGADYGDEAAPPPSAGGDDDADGDMNPPPPPPDGGGGTDVLSLADYDVAHRSFSLSIDPAEDSPVRLAFDFPQGVELDCGQEDVLGAGESAFQTTYSFTDDALLGAELNVNAYEESTDELIGWEYLSLDRPVAITDFNYEPAYGRLRGWVNISGSTTVELEVPQGVMVDGPASATLDESGFIEFPITLEDGFESGTATAFAEDEYGNTHQRSTAVYGAQEYAPDTLYAYPMQTSAAVNEPVTIVVASGVTQHPLQFASSISVTVDAGGEYVADTFNIGLPGGKRTDSDGIWAAMGIPNGQFLDLGDTLLPGAGTVTGGRRALEFAVVSMGPYPAANAPGVLFNFQLRFSQPGTYRIGLREKSEDFDMTYYSDGEGVNYFWGALQADTAGNANPDVTGYANTIVVE